MQCSPPAFAAVYVWQRDQAAPPRIMDAVADVTFAQALCVQCRGETLVKVAITDDLQ
tara:strand:+ start:430 stop:600 length:171 start_codon:yes stop_codon:yes gene_type:complete